MRWSARFGVSWICLWTHLLYLALAQEKPSFEARPFEDVPPFRQNVCNRSLQVEAGEVELRDALKGLELRPIMGDPKYFVLNKETGAIDADYPGIIAVLLDELARRAGFTWRNSFGVIQNAEGTLTGVLPPNRTWAEVLAWSVDQYDLSASWWPATEDRLNMGVSFLEPWYDSSIILIGKEYPPEDTNSIDLWNWLKPYHNDVWFLVLATIIMSGFVHQWLEWMADEREGRTLRRWTADSLYTSMLNFTQNYEYEPRNAAGRLFGVSMAIWALVMTATYTANLASLLVENKKSPFTIESIEDAVIRGLPICTYKNSYSDGYIEGNYPRALRVPKGSEIENFNDLHAGKCAVVATSVETWKAYRRNREVNPHCDLKWVGRTVEQNDASFAAKADSGFKCTSLINAVLTVHLVEMKTEGVLDKAWEEHLSKYADIDCDSESAYLYSDADAVTTPPTTEGPKPTFAPSSSLSTKMPTPEPTFDPSRQPTVSPVAEPAQTFSPSFTPTAKPHGTTFEIIAPNRNGNRTLKATSPNPQCNSKRKLQSLKSPKQMERRLAPAPGNSSSSSGDDDTRLTIQQMLGTFVLHYILTAVAMGIAVVSNMKKKVHEQWKKAALKEAIEKREEEIELRRIHEEEQMGKEPEGSPDVVDSIRRRVSSYNGGNMDQSSARHAPSPLFRSSTRTTPGLLKQNTRTLPGLMKQNTRGLTTQQFAQVRELLSDESRVSVDEIGGDELVANLLKEDRPRLANKDSRYLQLQLEELQEGLAIMHDAHSQMQWGIEERLKLQQEYMDQQMSLIVVLLRELKFLMEENPRVPAVLPYATGTIGGSTNVTGSTTVSPFATGVSGGTTNVTGSTTVLPFATRASSDTMNVTGSTTVLPFATGASFDNMNVTGPTTVLPFATGRSSDSTNMTGSTRVLPFATATGTSSDRTNVTGPSTRNVTGSASRNVPRSTSMNRRVPRAKRINSARANRDDTETTTAMTAVPTSSMSVPGTGDMNMAGASSMDGTEATTVNGSGASSDDQCDEPEIDLTKPVDSEC